MLWVAGGKPERAWNMNAVGWVFVVAAATGIVIIASFLISMVVAWIIRRVMKPPERAEDVAERAVWPVRAGAAAVGVCIMIIALTSADGSAPTAESPTPSPEPSMAVPSSPAPSPSASARPSPTSSTAQRALVWSDEFEGPAGAPADPANWSQETGGGGWGNQELQYYTEGAQNASLDGNGNLVITVRQIDPATTDLQCWYGPCAYTSARLVSVGKQDFLYGRVEARMKFPAGGGIWPAFWMLGTDIAEVGWPQTGEIDVVEFVGRSPNEIFGTIHGPGYSGDQSWSGIYDFNGPVAGQWHEFAVEWSPDLITWEVDGSVYHQATPADVAPDQWVFNHPFSLITNVAIGGNFGGALGGDLQLPQEFSLDYIRVYERG